MESKKDQDWNRQVLFSLPTKCQFAWLLRGKSSPPLMSSRGPPIASPAFWQASYKVALELLPWGNTTSVDLDEDGLVTGSEI